jgi:hypothetical protein
MGLDRAQGAAGVLGLAAMTAESGASIGQYLYGPCGIAAGLVRCFMDGSGLGTNVAGKGLRN